MKPAAKPLRYASYCRCSTDDQRHGDFTTIDNQKRANLEAIQAAIAEAGSGAFVGHFADEGRTGTNLERPEWRRLLAAVAKREVDVVVATYRHRIARGEAWYVAQYKLCRENRAVVVFSSEKVSGGSYGRMEERINVLGDGLFVERIRESTTSKMHGMVHMGYSTGGPRPFGYTSETVPGMADTILPGGKVKPAPRRRIPHPEESPLLVEAFRVFDRTDSLAEVRRYMRAVDPDGKPWDIDRVRRMLLRDVYIGVERCGEAVNYTSHERLIPESLWDSVQAKLATRFDRLTAGQESETGREGGYDKADRADTFAYYLRGLVYCSSCGVRMTPAGHVGATTTVPYYQCCRMQKAAKDGAKCPTPRINARTLHEVVLAEVARLGEHPTRLARFVREMSAALPPPTEIRSEIARLTRNRNAAERKKQGLLRALEASLGDLPASMVARIAEIEGQQQAIDAEMADANHRLRQMTVARPDLARCGEVYRRIGDLWQYGGEDERGEVLRLAVERVEMTENRSGTLHLILQGPATDSDHNTLVFGGTMGALIGQNSNSVTSVIGPSDHRLPSVYALLSPEKPRPATCRVPITVPSGGMRRRKGKGRSDATVTAD